jgi:UPF0755 protein
MSARRLGLALLLGLLLLAAVAAGAAAWLAQRWVDSPLPLNKPTVELTIEPGSSAREVANRWVAAGVEVPADWLYHWFRWSGDARRIRAGSYAIDAQATPRSLLQKMVQGDETMESVRLIEGWNIRQWREALTKAPHLQATTARMTEAELMAAIGAPGMPAEGRFFPDTYRYGRGVSDVTVLKQAYARMQQRLATAWEARAPNLPLKSADEVLIAGVFVNRLRIDMPLQTDPTVIYGLGEAFDGNLRKRDLLTDTAYNTYTRRGLPPTPIAMPGLDSLMATVQPQATKALYFVARGDGSSVFSENLSDHNRAVNTFQRRNSP